PGASGEARAFAREVKDTLTALVARRAKAAARPRPDEIRALLEDTKKHGPQLTTLRRRFDPQAMTISGEARLKVVALLNDLEVAVWIVHRLGKALALVAA